MVHFPLPSFLWSSFSHFFHYSLFINSFCQKLSYLFYRDHQSIAYFALLNILQYPQHLFTFSKHCLSRRVLAHIIQIIFISIVCIRLVSNFFTQLCSISHPFHMLYIIFFSVYQKAVSTKCIKSSFNFLHPAYILEVTSLLCCHLSQLYHQDNKTL